MKILLIDVNCKQSSTGKIVYDLYTNIRNQGNKAAICYGRGKKIKEPYIYKFGLDIETYIHAFLSRVTGYNGCFSFFSTRRLIRYIEKFQPDMIHIHELHAYFVNIKTLLQYIKQKKIKVIWTFHCEYMYTGKCGHAYDCEGWKSECGGCPAVKDYPKSLLFDRTNKMFLEKKKLLKDLDLVIVTPSQWLANRVKESFLKDKPVVVIHNGIDTDIFHPRKAEDLRKRLEIPADHKIVLAAAPDLMGEKKGGKYVVELAKEMKGEKVTFVLIGAKHKAV